MRAGGFTLLEVVVAVVIAGLALVGLFHAGSEGMFAGDSAGRVDQAIERAKSHLAALEGSGIIMPGEFGDDDGGGYHYSVRAQPLAQRQAAQPTQPGTTLFDVQVTISWGAGNRKRSVTLDSLRISAAPPSP